VNEQSIVLHAVWHDMSLLLTGDIGFPSEAELIMPAGVDPATVLKVPHHGSRYASSWEFIEQFSPVIAVAQAGRNPYGHPHDRTVRRYRGSGVQFFCTYWHGSVRLLSSDQGIRMITTQRGSIYDHPLFESEVRASESDILHL